MPDRFDVRSELLTGFPYKLPHAKALASLLSQLVRGPVPQKGLITDLDDTLWRGILGEVGVNGISWHLDQHSHMHGLYQQVLNALSAEGVLVAVVSKNERSLVEEAFRRRDILISSAAIFPFELTWGAKSEAIARVLKTWNVGPDSVVFIDDSPFELAEGKTSHPEMECIQFPTFDGPAIYELLERLRDRFGRSAILEEDAIRLDSIRRTHVAAAEGDLGGEELPRFLAQAEPELTFDFSGLPMDPRALELVNKTNQFNLNARRFTENSFQSYVGNPAAFSSVVSYRDKYGPLGKIAVLMGRKNGRKLRIDTWVMSCRAFSRHIEYQCLKELFDRFDVDEIEFDYLPTERNTPLGEFLGKILGVPPRPGPCLFRKEFLEKFPETFHSVQEVAHE